MQDPARPEVATAMLQCQAAGVRVIVMTGDSRETAVAIARDVNIFRRVRYLPLLVSSFVPQGLLGTTIYVRLRQWLSKQESQCTFAMTL